MTASMHDEIARCVERIFGETSLAPVREAVGRGEWPQPLWERVSRSGLASALAAERDGGVGASWLDAWPILRGIGFWQAPLPLAETMVARLLLSMARIEAPDEAIALVDRFALAEAADGPSIEVGARHLRIRASAARVPWARHCRAAWMTIPAAPGDAPAGGSSGHTGAPPGTLLWVDLRQGPAVRIRAGTNLAGEPCDDIEFVDAIARCVDNPVPAIGDPIRLFGALARSAMLVGALESALGQSIRYANERIQFGRPIGRFQAIQHALAQFAAELAAARMASIVAARSAPSTGSHDCATAAFDIAVAKLRCSEAATRAAPIAHQVHGAIGFTREHSLHEATGRLWTWRAEFGTDAQWADRLGKAAIEAGAEGFWPALTHRSFDTGW